uniref:hypothetical protein n=1 Tax=Serratia surfactantfaciens TaxID=2741499 RepID=UPI001B3CA2BF
LSNWVLIVMKAIIPALLFSLPFQVNSKEMDVVNPQDDIGFYQLCGYEVVRSSIQISIDTASKKIRVSFLDDSKRWRTGELYTRSEGLNSAFVSVAFSAVSRVHKPLICFNSSTYDVYAIEY